MACFLLLSGSAEKEAQTEADAAAELLAATVSEAGSEWLTEAEARGEDGIALADKLSAILKDGGKKAIGEAGGKLAGLLGLLLLSAVLHAVGDLSEEAGSKAICDYVTLLAAAGVVYGILDGLFRAVGTALQALAAFMTGMLPVAGAVMTASGSPTAAAGSAAMFSLFLSVVGVLSSEVLFPFLKVSFALCFAGAMPGSVDLSPLFSLVKNTAGVLLAFLYTTLGFLIGVQNAVSSATDSYLFRTVKFASGVFIPVVGGILGEAARTVAGGFGVIRATVGTAGVVVTLGLLVPPLLSVAAHRFLLSLCGAVARMLGCAREGQLLADLGGVVGLLFGLLAGTEAVAILYLATICLH